MATTITCDLCGKEVRDKIRIELGDGEHPHNGSRMTIIKDTCLDCASKISRIYPLTINLEIEDAIRLIKN